MFIKAEAVYEMNNKPHHFFGLMAVFMCILVFPVYAEEGTVDGGQLYNQYCAVCHKSGLNAAPKYGNKALWTNRVKQGREKVYENAINGLRGMPPRGGYPDLTDEQVKAATDYLVSRSGGWGDN